MSSILRDVMQVLHLTVVHLRVVHIITLLKLMA